jgi:hypothetical protein
VETRTEAREKQSSFRNRAFMISFLNFFFLWLVEPGKLSEVLS